MELILLIVILSLILSFIFKLSVGIIKLTFGFIGIIIAVILIPVIATLAFPFILLAIGLSILRIVI